MMTAIVEGEKPEDCCQTEASCRKKSTIDEKNDEIKSLLKVMRPPMINRIPDDILSNPLLQEAVARLPSHYNFEIYKTVWHVQRYKAQRGTLLIFMN
jgi:hypothetical protein